MSNMHKIKTLLNIFCLSIFLIAVTGCNNNSSSDKETTQNNAQLSPIVVESIPSAGLKQAQKFLAKEKPTALYIYAEWCPHCKKFSPIIKEVKSNVNNVEVKLLNYDEHREFAKTINLTGIPKVLLFGSDKKYAKSINGNISKEDLETELRKLK